MPGKFVSILSLNFVVSPHASRGPLRLRLEFLQLRYVSRSGGVWMVPELFAANGSCHKCGFKAWPGADSEAFLGPVWVPQKSMMS